MTQEMKGCCSLNSGPLDADDSKRFAERFAILSDPTRLRLISFITARGCTPTYAGELVEPLGVSQPTVSHHLKKLTDVGLLTREKRGRFVYFAVIPDAFDELRLILDLR